MGLGEGSSVVLLGEPTGWDGPYYSFSDDGTLGNYVVYGYNFVLASTGTPIIRKGAAAAGGGAHLRAIASLDNTVNDWREHDGQVVGTGVDPYVTIPVTPDQAYRGVQKPDGTQIIMYGNLGPTALNRIGTFDPVANTWTTGVIANYPDVRTDLPALCLGGDGNIYGFGGRSSAGARHGQTQRLDGTVWTQLATNPANGVDGYYKYNGGFAVPISGNRIFTGGGERGGPSKQLGTFIYDIATDTFSNGPLLPDEPGETYTENMQVAPLDNGNIYIATEQYSRVYVAASNTLKTLSVSAGELHNAVPLDTDNNDNCANTLIALPDGRLCCVTRAQGTWISTHA